MAAKTATEEQLRRDEAELTIWAHQWGAWLTRSVVWPGNLDYPQEYVTSLSQHQHAARLAEERRLKARLSTRERSA